MSRALYILFTILFGIMYVLAIKWDRMDFLFETIAVLLFVGGLGVMFAMLVDCGIIKL